MRIYFQQLFYLFVHVGRSCEENKCYAECKYTCGSVFYLLFDYLKVWHAAYWGAKRANKRRGMTARSPNEYGMVEGKIDITCTFFDRRIGI